jgi:antitoxin MazE
VEVKAMRGAGIMQKRLVRHGNSRAIVIDKAILDLLGIDDGTDLRITTNGTSLTITPASAGVTRRARLDDALDRIEARYPNTLDRLAE